MLDAKRLLDQFLGPQQAPDGQGNAPAGGAAAQDSGSGFSVGNLIGDTGSFAKGAAAGGILGLLLGGKKPKKLAKTALTYGGAAVVGGLAYRAWQNWQTQKAGGGGAAPAQAPQQAPAQQPRQPIAMGSPDPVLPPPGDTAFLPDNEADQQDLSRALVRAMIAAAKADGHVTPEEQSRIFENLSALSLERDDQAFVLEELGKPLDIEAVAAEAKTPEQAAEIYAASLLAIDPSGPAERGYLGLLAARLKLDPALVEHLHASIAEAEAQAVS